MLDIKVLTDISSSSLAIKNCTTASITDSYPGDCFKWSDFECDFIKLNDNYENSNEYSDIADTNSLTLIDIPYIRYENFHVGKLYRTVKNIRLARLGEKTAKQFVQDDEAFVWKSKDVGSNEILLLVDKGKDKWMNEFNAWTYYLVFILGNEKLIDFQMIHEYYGGEQKKDPFPKVDFYFWELAHEA